jgi:hypothetical protein
MMGRDRPHCQARFLKGEKTMGDSQEQRARKSRVISPSTWVDYCARALRSVHWNSARVLLVGAAGLFWWLGCEYVHRLGQYSPLSPGIPNASRTDDSNNKAAALRLPVNLEGTAVAYPEEVAALVRPDGEFRTELSLSEMASVLVIDPRTIAKQGSQNEIDSEAVLFKAVTGRLSERAMGRSRRARETEPQGLQAVLATTGEWVTVEVPFCLNALRHPNQEQKVILDAISRSARDLVREPGAKANAVPAPWLHAGGRSDPVEFAGGYLPLEPVPVDRGTDENPPPHEL